MITVGISNLRNSLSRYIDMVRGGETVLVTDHNRIVAEIVPTDSNLAGSDVLEAYTAEQIGKGAIIGATQRIKLSKKKTGSSAAKSEIDRIYSETREDRT